MEQKLLQLERRVSDLTKWKESRQKERLRYPLDPTSQKALRFLPSLFLDPLIIPTGKTINSLFGLGLITHLVGFGINVNINGQVRTLLAMLALKAFTANAGTDFITATDGNHNLNNGDGIALSTTSALPAGLNETTVYYIINRTGTTFQVSTSIGGSAVNITDTGTGTHYYGKL